MYKADMINSAMTEAIAAPFAPKQGTKTRFKVRFENDPVIRYFVLSLLLPQGV